MAILNNNEVATLVNTAVAMATGETEVATMDLQTIIDTGNDISTIGTVDQFTKALLNVIIDTYFHETLYENTIKNKFLITQEEFGAYIQILSMEFPEAQPSHVFRDFSPTESGRAKVGLYDVYTPVVEAQIMGKTVSWEIPISISEEQLKTAWHNTMELNKFVNYVKMVVQSSINLHLEQMDMANINNYIAEKIAYSNSDDTTGIHVINFVKKYHDEVDSTVTTVSAFRKNPDALRWASGVIDLYSKYFTKVSTMFNNSNKKRHTPKDRQVLLILSEFETMMKTVSYANTYNPDYIKLENYESIPFWQGETMTTVISSGDEDEDDTEIEHTLDFDVVSSINVKTSSDGTTINKSGIVGLLVDKYAILHMIRKHRVAVIYHSPEALVTTFNQFQDNYSNDLTQNGIVFTLEDVQ